MQLCLTSQVWKVIICSWPLTSISKSVHPIRYHAPRNTSTIDKFCSEKAVSGSSSSLSANLLSVSSVFSIIMTRRSPQIPNTHVIKSYTWRKRRNLKLGKGNQHTLFLFETWYYETFQSYFIGGRLLPELLCTFHPASTVTNSESILFYLCNYHYFETNYIYHIIYLLYNWWNWGLGSLSNFRQSKGSHFFSFIHSFKQTCLLSTYGKAGTRNW